MTRSRGRRLALLLPLLLAGCSPEQDRTPETVAPAEEGRPLGSVAVVAVPDEPDILAPPLARSPVAAAYWPWILPSLVRPAPGGLDEARFARDLAADWVVEADGRTARFVLRTDRLWDDTTAVSVDDVVQSYRIYLDRRRAGDWAERLAEIAAVAADLEDSAAVVFRFRSPLSRARILQLASLPLVQAAQWRAAAGAAVPPGSPGRPIRTAGPFRILEWTRGGALRLARHPFPPPGRRPAAPELLLRFVPSGRSRIVLLEEGVADLAIDLPQRETLRLREGPLAEGIHRVGPVRIETLVFNLDDPVLGSLDLRKEIETRFDSGRLSNAVTPHGEAPLGSRCGGFVLDPPGGLAPPAPRRERSGGEPIALTYWIADPRRAQTAVELALQLDDVGPGWTLDPIPHGEWAERIASRRFQAILVGWSVPTLPDLGEIYGSRGLVNLAGLYDPEVEAAIARARSPEADSVPGLWRAVEERARERIPILFLEKRDRIDVVDPRIGGYRPDPSMPIGNLLTIERPPAGAREDAS